SGTPDRQTGLGMSISPRNAETESEQRSLSLHLKGHYNLLGRSHELAAGVVDHKEDTMAAAHDRGTFAPVGEFNRWDGSYPQPAWGPASVSNEGTAEQFGIYGVTRLSLTEGFKLIVGARLADWDQRGFDWQGPHDFGHDDVLIPYAGALYDITDNHKI